VVNDFGEKRGYYASANRKEESLLGRERKGALGEGGGSKSDLPFPLQRGEGGFSAGKVKRSWKLLDPIKQNERRMDWFG